VKLFFSFAAQRHWGGNVPLSNGFAMRCAGAIQGKEGGIQMLAGIAPSSQTVGSNIRVIHEQAKGSSWVTEADITSVTWQQSSLFLSLSLSLSFCANVTQSFLGTTTYIVLVWSILSLSFIGLGKSNSICKALTFWSTSLFWELKVYLNSTERWPQSTTVALY